MKPENATEPSNNGGNSGGTWLYMDSGIWGIVGGNMTLFTISLGDPNA